MHVTAQVALGRHALLQCKQLLVADHESERSLQLPYPLLVTNVGQLLGIGMMLLLYGLGVKMADPGACKVFRVVTQAHFQPYRPILRHRYVKREHRRFLVVVLVIKILESGDSLFRFLLKLKSQ